ncbi:isoaspartyl peptidase/L-asparaginase [Brevibacterium samyangense]|uniref:Isoaspartyl peptidase/L-asparaginase n=1 Tax=Brevibacterium samyangense TaxID=366888 RepID=A0ABP5F1S0_9MICO
MSTPSAVPPATPSAAHAEAGLSEVGPTPVIAIHGGAGALSRSRMTPEREQEYREALAGIVRAGQEVLASGGTAVDAVQRAVTLLEDSPLFNAGHGAVFTSAATHELDAAIMDGATLNTGAVAGVHTVKSPITLARAVMENSDHVLFAGEGAEAFARDHGLEIVSPDYFSTPERRAQLDRARQRAAGTAVLDHDGEAAAAEVTTAEATAQPGAGGASGGGEADSVVDPLDADTKYGTVGAVALDAHGNLAAATSTGGMTNKQVGRVGDTPVIGAGTYAANATCAVSATGTGEMFIRMVAAYDVAARMEYAGESLEQATRTVVHEKLPTIGGDGGLIAVDASGNVALPFNTEGMYRGFGRVGEEPTVGIYRGE